MEQNKISICGDYMKSDFILSPGESWLIFWTLNRTKECSIKSQAGTFLGSFVSPKKLSG